MFKTTPKIIIGIDPGIADAGYGVIEVTRKSMRCLAAGSIKTATRLEVGERLAIIYKKLEELILKFKPTEAGIEKIYFSKNVKTALMVAEARGAIRACLALQGVEIFEYSPQAVKIAVTGVGNASKNSVGLMVKKLLKLKEVPRPDDAADALAIALTQAVTH